MISIKDPQALLYDVLARGKQTTDIKQGLLYSIIVVEVYNKSPITIRELERIVNEKYHIKKDSLLLEVNELKRQKRLQGAPSNSNLISVTAEESAKLLETMKKSHEEEEEFNIEFNKLLADFDIKSNSNLKNDLIEIYRQQYVNDINNDKNVDGMKSFRQTLSTLIKEERVSEFVDRLKEICANNSFVNKTAATSSFLHLYDSKEFNSFIKDKTRLIFLDTPILVYILCYITALYEDAGEDWNDPYYMASKSLYRLAESHGDKVQLFAMEGYVDEVVGELKKAFMIDRIYRVCGGRSIWGETNNTFYTYFRYIKSVLPDDAVIDSFDEFVEAIGLKAIVPEAKDFKSKEMTALIDLLDYYNIEVKYAKRSDKTKKLEELYSWILQERGGIMKPASSQTHDVQQVEYCATDSNFESMNNTDRSVATWDFSLAKLRKDLLNEFGQQDNSFFYVHNPAKQANSIALAAFDINSTCITNDIFCYAEERYLLSHKAKACIEDLYPLIGNLSEKNAKFMRKLIRIQDKEFGSFSDNDLRHDTDKVPLGEILMGLMEAFCENKGLESMTGLWKDYIEETENAQPLIDILSTAISAKKNSENYDYVAQTVLLLNEFSNSKNGN